MKKYRRLTKSFYQREDVLQIAKELIGKFLVTNIAGQHSAGMIVEAEAYRAPDDTACHASKHGKTQRTQVMYMSGGHAYVYKCYGIHDLFNVVTGKKDQAHAVLIRGIEPADNIDLIMERRNIPKLHRTLGAGPGVLTKALGIQITDDATNMLDKKSPIWIEDRGVKFSDKELATGPRVGCESAGKSAFWPWRYCLKGSQWVSNPRL